MPARIRDGRHRESLEQPCIAFLGRQASACRGCGAAAKLQLAVVLLPAGVAGGSSRHAFPSDARGEHAPGGPTWSVALGGSGARVE